MNNSCTLSVPVEPTSVEVTQLLQRLCGGDKAAADEIAPHVYGELRKLAAYYLRREHPAHTWQTTDLVNEAYLRLAGTAGVNFKGRSHFFGIAAQIMRRILTDYARRKRAEKRGGQAAVVSLDEDIAMSSEQCDRVADLDEALRLLEAINPRSAKVVELRFFGGLTEEETAEVLDVCARTVKREWSFARAWLFKQLTPEEPRFRAQAGGSD